MSTTRQEGPAVWRLEPVRTAEYPLAQERVTCVLYRLRYERLRYENRPDDRAPGYMIGMETPTDRSLCYAGSDPAGAEAFFDLLVQGTVSPCTLPDIAGERE